MRYGRQLRGQDSGFFSNRLVFVHNKHLLAPDFAETAFDLETCRFQVLL